MGTHLTSALAGSSAAEQGTDAKTAVIVVALLLGVGFAFHRLVVPLIRATAHLLEWVAEMSIKIGVALMAAGAVAAVGLVLYATTSLGGG
jgi:hypothetical protein